MNRANAAPQAYLQDRPVLSKGQRRLIGLVLPIVLAGLATILAHPAWLGGLERLSIDWRFRERGPLKPSDRIVLVHLSEDDRRALTEGEAQFNLRAHLADAIDRLANAGAVTIGTDFWLQGLGDSAIDARLAEAIAGANVVLGVAISNNVSMRAASVFLNAEPDEGCIAVQPDPDAVLRRLPELPNLDLLVDADGGTVRIPHFPFVLVYLLFAEDAHQAGRVPPWLDLPARGAARLGDRVVPYGTLINYAAGPGDGFVTLDFADVVRGTSDLAPVDGAIVIIGPTRSLEDQFAIPLSRRLVPGLYYHANVIDMILQDRFLAEWPGRPRDVALLVAALAVAAGWYAFPVRGWWTCCAGWFALLVYFAAGAAVFVGGWCVACHWAFRSGTVLPMTPPLVAMSAMLLCGLTAQLAVTIASARRLTQRNRQIESLFGRSVSTQVLEAIKADPGRIARTEVREVSVLFCDIRGFTATSTRLAPEAVAEMLNEYFDATTSAVFAHDGFLDKFVGDELMAVFGAPLEQSDHANRAADAAVAIKQALRVLNARRAERGLDPLDCGIGIHTGPVAAGHIGTAQRANYTVVGDTVNMAARIESQTKAGEILISEALRDKLADPSRVVPWNTVTLRGSDRMHTLFELRVDP